jgi:hypothetical protein
MCMFLVRRENNFVLKKFKQRSGDALEYFP